MNLGFLKQIELDIQPLSKKQFTMLYRQDIRGIIDWKKSNYISKITVKKIINNFESLGNLYTDWSKKGESFFSTKKDRFKDIKETKTVTDYNIGDLIILRVPAIKHRGKIFVMDGNHRISSILHQKKDHVVIVDIVESLPGFSILNSVKA